MYSYVSCMYSIVSNLVTDIGGCRTLYSSVHPPPHYQGTRSTFSPSIDECWYGRVNLIFKMRVRTDAGSVMECQCALIEILYDYCPREGRGWWPSTAEIGPKLLYLPSPDPGVYIVPLSHILGRLPLLPAGDYGTIP